MKFSKITALSVILVCALTDALLASTLTRTVQQKIVSPASP